MTETQGELLKLFKEIADICDRNDIVYYMAGGTLIGVLRHKGFVPWDDDLDIMMTRDNWLRFVEICKNELPENRKLECQELNRDFPNVLGRYTDLDTTAIHENEVLGDGSPGYVIDILPMDPVPDTAAHKKYVEDIMLYSDLVNPTTQYSYRLGLNKDRYTDYLDKIKKYGKDKVLSELEKEMFCYKEDECDYLVLRWGGVPFLFDKTLYGHSRWGEFEGVKCRIPDRSSDYLVQHFGDEWTTIPPHEEQDVHNAVFSLTVDFKTMQNDYMPFIDEGDIREKWHERKLFYFDHMMDRILANTGKSKVKAQLYKLETEKRIASVGVNLAELVEQHRFGELDVIFSDYFSKQWERGLIGREDFSGMQRFTNPILIDISDDHLYAAMMTLINTNRISKAARIIEVRKIVKGELSPHLAYARDTILRFRNIISVYDAGKTDEAIKLAEEMFDDHPCMLSLELFLSREYVRNKIHEKAEPLLESMLTKYPDDGFFMKYKADLLMEKYSDREQAMQLYEMATEKTQNGIVLMEIDEIMERINK